MASLTHYVDIALQAVGWDAPHPVDLSIAADIGGVILFFISLTVALVYQRFALRRDLAGAITRGVR